MIGEGLELMLYGMGMVFCFLILLVVVMNLTGAFFQKHAAKFPGPVPEAKPTSGASRTAGDTNAKVAAAVAAAYRARKGA